MSDAARRRTDELVGVDDDLGQPFVDEQLAEHGAGHLFIDDVLRELGELFVDGVRFTFRRGPSESSAELERRVADCRRRLKRSGLKPSAQVPRYGLAADRRSFQVSIAPIRDAQRLGAIVDDLERAGARVAAIELARDVLDEEADVARARYFPASDPQREDVERNAYWLRDEGEATGRYWKGTTYATPRDSERNLVVYTDRPSKLRPCGPSALHIELRLQGRALAERLRSPRALLTLLDEAAHAELWNTHTRRGTRFALSKDHARARAR